MLKKNLFFLSIIMFCYSNWLSAQELRTVFPKNNQNVNSEVEFSWSDLNETVDSYRLIIGHQGVIFKDTLIKAKKVNIYLPIGEYNWKVFALINSSIIDSTQSTFSIFNPSQIDSLNLWLNSDTNDLILVKDSFVYQWKDISSKHNNTVSQSNAGLQPHLSFNKLNGYSSIRFENANSNFCRLDLTNTLSSKNYSIYMVYNHYHSDFRRRILYNFGSWWIGINRYQYVVADSTFLSGKNVIKGQFVVQNVYAANDSLYNFINGLEYDKKKSINVPGSNLRLGLDEPFSDFLEIIMINDSISPQVRQSIDHYLMDKYAPPINLGADKKVCSFPTTIATDIDYALHYQWSTGDTTASTPIDSAGKYYLTITDMFERTSKDSIYVGLDTSDVQFHFNSSDTTICSGDSVVLSGPNTNRFSYSWNTNDSSSSIKVSQAGKYVLSVENCLSKISKDSIQVKVNQPIFSLGRDTTACFYSPIALKTDSNFSNVNYLWSNGDTTSNLLADTNGIYGLTVVDKYGCSYTDSITISIDSSLFGISLGADTTLCEGNVIGIQHPNPNFSYRWSNGDTTATTTIDTAGSYVLQISNGNCQILDTINIHLKGEAPDAAFSAMGFCRGDSVRFQDLSSNSPNAFLSSWEWHFGDADSSSKQNPAHYYTTTDSFLVALKVSTNKGCADITTQWIKINPRPKAKMEIANHCAKEKVFFSDSSTVTSGNIIGYRWDFGDTLAAVNSSNQKNPTHIYDTLGTYKIQLIVSSDFGCSDTVQQYKRIHAVPNIQFSQIGKCLGDSTQLIDETTLASGKIKNYLWTLNNQFSSKQNPKVIFPTAGKKKITVSMTTDSACQAVFTDSIDIFSSPHANFVLQNSCENTSFQPIDSSSGLYPIKSWRYIFANADTSFLQQPTFNSAKAGSFPLQQLVIDGNACRDSITKMVTINPLPTADFTILDNGSGAPYRLRIENKSVGAATYLWKLGNSARDTAKTPNYVYPKAGDYHIQLSSISAENCKDSTEQLLHVLPYYLDASIEKLQLVETADGLKNLQIRIANVGNNAIEKLQIATNINNGGQFVENLNGPILKSRTKGYQLSTAIKPTQNMNFVCVHINSVNTVSDSIEANNKACQAIGKTDELYLNLFPNPAVDYMNLEYVLPQDGEIYLTVYDSKGGKVLENSVGKQAAGYYLAQLRLTNLRTGIYHLSFSYNGSMIERTFIKK